MREDDRPDRWDNPDPDRPQRLDGPDRLDSRDRLDRPEGNENEKIIEERVVSRTTELEYEEPPPPVRTEVPIRAPPPRSYRWVGALIVAVALIAAAFGAYALLNQESPSSPETTPRAPTPEVTSPNNTTPVAPGPNVTEPVAPVEPNDTAPETAVNGTVTDVTELTPEAVDQGSSDTQVTVAVDNPAGEAVPVSSGGFYAVLADGTVVYPTNAADVSLVPGTTDVTLNFPTGGQAISSIGFSDGTTAFVAPVEGDEAGPEVNQVSVTDDPSVPSQQLVTVNVQPEADSAPISDVRAHTANGEVYQPQVYRDPGDGSTGAIFCLCDDDSIVGVSFVQNGETQYVEL